VCPARFPFAPRQLPFLLFRQRINVPGSLPFTRLTVPSPLQSPRLARKTAPPASTPLEDFCLPPDQSVLLDLLSFGPPSQSTRFPIAPRRRFLSLVFRLRITVPGPLRLGRLAVPQTSWNQSQYAPESPFGQSLLWQKRRFSSRCFGFVSNQLQGAAVNCL
jgi:hypothetical protein